MAQEQGLMFEIKGNRVHISFPADKVEYETEKNHMLASSHGWAPIGPCPSGKLKGRMISVSLNAGIRK